MALRLKNRVQETTTTTGTGTVTLSAAAPTGFQTFANALTDGDTTYYQITDGTDWEIGLGTFISATNELQRTEVFESTNSDAKVSFGAGSKDVFIVMPAEKVSGTTSYGATSDLPLTANQVGDQAFVTANNNLYIWSGTGWYKIATVNQTPTISGNIATYELATNGTATIVTLTGTDPEGTPLTWSATESGDTGIATTTNVDNVFTITPVTSGSGGTMSVTFAASDGVNTATASSTFTLVFSAALWPDVVLSIGTSDTNSLDNSTFIDRSTNAHTITTTNTPIQTAFHPYLDNWSGYFENGDSDVLSIADTNTDFDVYGGDFTVEAWVYPTALNTYNYFISKGHTTTREWGFGFSSSNVVAYWSTNGSGTGDQSVVLSVTNNIREWMHLAFVKSGNTITIYKNGVSLGSGAFTSIYAGSDPVYISRFLNYTGISHSHDGYISNLRILKGTALYTATFTPPTEKLTAVTNTTFLACQSNRFIDSSSQAQSITVSGNPEVSALNPFGQGSEYAVGENKGSCYYLQGDDVVATGSIVDVGTGDYTAEFWTYGVPDSDVVLDLRNGTTNSAGALIMAKTTGFRYQSSSTATTTGDVHPADKQWNHFAFVRDSGTVKCYINGVGQTLLTSDATNFTSTSIAIGSNNGSGYDIQDGFLADLRISKSAVYTSNFTPPTSPVGNTNASLYLPFDNAGIFDKTSNTDIGFIGTGITTSTAQTKYADTAIYFPSGSNNALTVKYADWMNIGTNDFTLELWVRPDGNADALWSFGADGENRLDFGWQSTSGIRLLIETGNVSNTVFTSTDSASTYANTWVHIALTKSGTNYKLWVNGTNTASGTSSLTLSADTVDGWTFGAREFDADMTTASNNVFSGYMENIQFLIGTPKYTSSFTPPTQEQGRIYQAED